MRVALLTAVVSLALAAPGGAKGHFPQSVTGTVPAGGNLSVSSGSLGNATNATITAAPADDSSARFFNGLTKVLSTGRTPGKRVLTCVSLYAIVSGAVPNDVVSFKQTDPSLALLFLRLCLTVALSINNSQSAAHAAAGCPQLTAGVPVSVRRSGGRYTVTATGKLRGAKSAVRVSCRRKGRGIQMRLRSRSRNRPLRKVLGDNLELGYLSPSGGSPVRVKTTFNAS